MIDGKEHNVHFAQIAINVVQPKDGQDKILPRILRGWFGPDAGQPDTMGRVTLERVEDDWHLKPCLRAVPSSASNIRESRYPNCSDWSLIRRSGTPAS